MLWMVAAARPVDLLVPDDGLDVRVVVVQTIVGLVQRGQHGERVFGSTPFQKCARARSSTWRLMK